MPRLLLPFLVVFTTLWLCWSSLAVPRQVVLVEHFTNTGSNDCAARNPGIYSVLNTMTRDSVILLSYHVWWPSDQDPFYQWNPSDIAARTSLYDPPAVPYLYVDHVYQPATTNPAVLRSNIRTRYAAESPCSIVLSAVPSGTTGIRFAAQVTAETDLLSPDQRLFVMLVTDQVNYMTPPGSNGELNFPDPFRDAVPHPSEGQELMLAAGEAMDFEGVLNRMASWNATDLTVIAFVQNLATLEILQANWVEVRTAPAGVTLNAPNGGEVWYTGEAHEIAWFSSALDENIRIQLNRDYPLGLWQTIQPATGNDGSYSWTVTGPPTTTARIRVTGTVELTSGDSSDTDFSIAGIALTAPNGGETLLAGVVDTIRWNTAALPENVRIELNRDYPAGAWEAISASTANDGIHPWTPAAPLTQNARIRILGTTHTAVGDTSDADFGIDARSITVGTPNGGEVWVAGSEQTISWDSQNVNGNVLLQINRSYPGGVWDTLAARTANDGEYLWTVMPPASTGARIRITSWELMTVQDLSDANFSIALPDLMPVLLHDPLDDFAPGTGTITATAYDRNLIASIATVTMYYRPAGGGTFTTLTLQAAGGTEFTASLAAITTHGRYEYYVRAEDNGGHAAVAPEGAPAQLYTFDVSDLCSRTISYDDGTAEYFNWTGNQSGVNTLWAVKFGPVRPPYAVCGVQYAISRMLPDAAHSPVYVAVLAANGANGLPGTVLYQTTNGSVGNEPGGLPAGTHWAQAIFRDTNDEPLLVNHAEFYVAVGNTEAGKMEGFGRDTSPIRYHRSYFYDYCDGQWYSEDDTLETSNAHPGNRMIRVSGFSLAAPQVTIARSGNDIVLRWDGGAPVYRVYVSATADGPFNTLLGSSVSDLYIHTGALNTAATRYYRVVAATE